MFFSCSVAQYLHQLLLYCINASGDLVVNMSEDLFYLGLLENKGHINKKVLRETMAAIYTNKRILNIISNYPGAARGHLPLIDVFQKLHQQELNVVSKNGCTYPQFTVLGNLESLPTIFRSITNIPIYWRPGPVFTRYTEEVISKTHILNEELKQKYGYDYGEVEKMAPYTQGVQAPFKKLRAYLNDCGVQDVFSENWTLTFSYPFPNEV